jgi:hypothetical protein
MEWEMDVLIFSFFSIFVHSSDSMGIDEPHDVFTPSTLPWRFLT